jgi:hypothetical protein
MHFEVWYLGLLMLLKKKLLDVNFEEITNDFLHAHEDDFVHGESLIEVH